MALPMFLSCTWHANDNWTRLFHTGRACPESMEVDCPAQPETKPSALPRCHLASTRIYKGNKPRTQELQDGMTHVCK